MSTQTSPYFAPDPIGAGHCNLTGEGHVCGFLFELQTFPHYWHRWLTLRRHSLLYSLQMGMMVPRRQNTNIFQPDAILQVNAMCNKMLYHNTRTHIFISEGSLEVKLPTIWTNEKQRWEESEKRREEKRRRKKNRKEKESEDRRCSCAKRFERVEKSQITVFFPMICGFGGSKSRLAKAAGAEPCGQMGDEKLHATVARSTFPSQNVQSTSASDHFWKIGRRRSARRCGAKHISKSKV